MRVLNYKQGTDEWLKARLGILTGSKLKGVHTKDNLPLIDKLIAEQMTEMIEDEYQSKEMRWGTEQEPRAIKLYQEMTKYKKSDIQFALHDEHDWLGISPDFFTEDLKGGAEFKCPSSKIHVEYCRTNKIPAKHKYQCHGYFHVNENMEWLDFVSYDPRNKVKPINIVRITREEIAEELEKEMQAMLKFKDKWFKYYSQIAF